MFWILLIIIVGIVWYTKTYKASVKQFNLTANYLIMLMLVCKSKDDFEKVLWRMYSYDSDTLPIDEFNTKWEAMCSAAKTPIVKNGNPFVSSSVVEVIADNIYNDPQNRRYIKNIDSLYPDTVSLEELKKRQR